MPVPPPIRAVARAVVPPSVRAGARERLATTQRARRARLDMRSQRMSAGAPIHNEGATVPGWHLAQLWGGIGGEWRGVDIDVPFEARSIIDGDTSALSLVRATTADGTPFVELGMCRTTGLVHHRLVPPTAWMQHYYSKEWDEQGRPSPDIDPHAYATRRGNKVHSVVGDRLAPRSRVLDIGAGYGDQLHHFASAGHVTVGIEPSGHRARFASEVMGLDVRNHGIDQPDALRDVADGGPFDLVYLNQVLEHLVDPVGTLRQVREVVRDDGLLLVAVPDVEYESLAMLVQSTVHLSSFSYDALVSAGALAGFEPVTTMPNLGYLTVLFRPAAPLATCDTAPQHRALRAVLQGVGAIDVDTRGRARAAAPGDVVSIRSVHTGPAQVGLRCLGAPALDDHALRTILYGGSVHDLERLVPVTIATPYETPRLWFK